jgi:glycosyltransferase involved in cell wall biosynthesis
LKFNHVLYIGPQNEKGGIGAVLETYRAEMDGFSMISTYPSDAKTNKQYYFLKQLISILKLLITDDKIKILHIHCASKGSFLRKSMVAVLANTFGKKTIMHIHGGLFHRFYQSSRLMTLLVRSILRSCDRVICLTTEWSNTFRKELDLANLSVVLNPVRSYSFQPYRDSFDTISLLFLGTITDNKGIFELVNYLHHNPFYLQHKIKLTICGEGETDRLLSLINSETDVRKIIYVGWVNGVKKDELFAESDIFILPSHFEGLPMAILEAMSAGKPIISTAVGGIPSVVKLQHNGWLIELGKINQLDPVIEQIFSDPAIISRYGINSFEDAKKFHANAIVAQLNTIYKELLTTD